MTAGTQAGLRAWAKGLYPLEAGVELLIRSAGGRFAGSGYPWIVQGDEDPTVWLVDVDEMNEDTFGALSGGETRMLRIAASLLNGQAVDLYENIAGLDREQVQLVLAAIAHASGSHQHSGGPVPDSAGRYVLDGVRMSFGRLGSLFPWPEAARSIHAV